MRASASSKNWGVSAKSALAKDHEERARTKQSPPSNNGGVDIFPGNFFPRATAFQDTWLEIGIICFYFSFCGSPVFFGSRGTERAWEREHLVIFWELKREWIGMTPYFCLLQFVWVGPGAGIGVS